MNYKLKLLARTIVKEFKFMKASTKRKKFFKKICKGAIIISLMGMFSKNIITMISLMNNEIQISNYKKLDT